MNNIVKNIVIAILLILLCGQFLFFLNYPGSQSSETIEPSSNVIEMDAKYEEQEKELNDLRKRVEEQQKYQEKIAREGTELIDKLPRINSLSELIEAYQIRMDGAVAEGYGARLAQLTEQEDINKLISILAEKNVSVIRDVLTLLFGEYAIQGNEKKIDSMLKKIESINLSNMSDKEKGIVFNLMAEGYEAKRMVKTGN